MSSKTPIAYIDIRTSAHATEDLEKVIKAVCNTLPANSIEIVAFKKTNLTGHHGNPITIIETRIKDKNIIHRTFEKIASELSIMDKELLNNEIKQHLENGNLYFRLDKQCAYLNELKLCQTDPIHYRIHFKQHSLQEIIETCRRFGLIP